LRGDSIAIATPRDEILFIIILNRGITLI